jgi:hypothetical protein
VTITDTEDLLAQRERLRVSEHALREAHKEGLRGKDILYAIFNGKIIEHYPERDRVLIAEIVAVTVYIPNRPRWITDQVRGLIPPNPLSSP